MSAPSTSTLAAENTGLRKMRRIATGVLAGLAGTFVGTHFFDDPSQSMLLLRAMAEAGMVGGLADWFAVEALFRRPLGLPIPHTGLLPANQKRAAKNVGAFFDTYFMDPAQLRQKLAGFDPAKHLANWLAEQENANIVAREITGVLATLLKGDIAATLTPKSGAIFQDTLAHAIDADLIAVQIEHALKGTLQGDLLDDLLGRAQIALRNNHDTIINMVQDRSRWWIAASIDERIAEVLIEGALSVLQELGDEGSDLRENFKASIGQIIDDIQKDGVLVAQIEKGKSALAGSDTFDELTHMLVAGIQTSLVKKLEEDPDTIARDLTQPLQDFAAHLAKDPEFCAVFNAKIFDGLEALLVQIRPSISAYVTETISNWDSDALVDRFESAVGRDLQFIRINGAVLGALIGAGLFFFSTLIA